MFCNNTAEKSLVVGPFHQSAFPRMTVPPMSSFSHAHFRRNPFPPGAYPLGTFQPRDISATSFSAERGHSTMYSS